MKKTVKIYSVNEYLETFFRDKTLREISIMIWGNKKKITFLSKASANKYDASVYSRIADELVNYAAKTNGVIVKYLLPDGADNSVRKGIIQKRDAREHEKDILIAQLEARVKELETALESERRDRYKRAISEYNYVMARENKKEGKII